MKATFCLFFLIFITMSAFCQDKLVTFNVKYDDTNYEYELAIKDSVSYWTAQTDEAKQTSFFMKNKRTSLLYFSDAIFNKTFYVIDSLHKMSWEFTDKQKVILEQPCASARTKFRGRTYTAYFTRNIMISDGPWKFGGLPGLILEVVSDDGLYQFTANKIMESKSKRDRVNIEKYKYISWSEFVRKFTTTVDNTIKSIRANIDADQKGHIKIGAPEIIYPKAQEGEGLEY